MANNPLSAGPASAVRRAILATDYWLLTTCYLLLTMDHWQLTKSNFPLDLISRQIKN